MTYQHTRSVPLAELAAAILKYMILVFFSLLVLIPLLVAVLGGFKTSGELLLVPFGLPQVWHTENYSSILLSNSFWKQLLNSTLVMLGTAVGVVVLASMAAFVFARISSHGREILFNFMTLGLLFPIAVAILPLYITLRQANLVDTLWGIILPQVAFALPINILILRGFFIQVPQELEEAAAMDGCSSIGFFWRILLPLARPALAAVVVLTMVASWNNFLAPHRPQQRAALYPAPRHNAVSGTVWRRLGKNHGVPFAFTRPNRSLLSRRRTAYRCRTDRGRRQGIIPCFRGDLSLIATPPTTLLYRDPAYSTGERVQDLMARMTLDEKIAHLGSYWIYELQEDQGLSQATAAERIGHGIGQITRRRRQHPCAVRYSTHGQYDSSIPRRAPRGSASRRSCTKSAVTAISHWARPGFPQMIGLASTWEPDLVEQMMTVVLHNRPLRWARGKDCHPCWIFAPRSTLGTRRRDLWRRPDARRPNGRCLCRGLQGTDLSSGVIATGKHFPGHANSEGGLNCTPVHLGTREMRDVFLVPFEAVIRRGAPCLDHERLFGSGRRGGSGHAL